MAKRPSVTPLEVVRDIALRILSKSIWVPTLPTVVIIYALYKAPPEQIYEIVKLSFSDGNKWSFIGWVAHVRPRF